MMTNTKLPRVFVAGALGLCSLWALAEVGVAQNFNRAKSIYDQLPKESDQAKSADSKAPRRKAPMPAFTPEREAAAMTFVRQHHPEVADLLEKLKANHPGQYRRAASGLFRASERLAQWKDRDPARYELELKAWKIQSRIQLLLARSTMAKEDNAAADAELRAALVEQAAVKLELRTHERGQLAKRLAQADEDIAKMKENRDTAIEQQLVSLRKGIDQSRRNMKARASGKANKKPSEKEAKAEAPSGK